MWSTQSVGLVYSMKQIFFLESPCFFYDPTNAGNLISDSSNFSKHSLCIWKFSFYILLKPTLKDFEQNLTSMQNKCNCTAVWTFFGIACSSFRLEWKLTFSSPVATAVLEVCWRIECSTLTASSFRMRNSSAGISSLPLALFIVMLPKGHLTSLSRISGSRWVTTPSWWYWPLRPVLYSSSVYSWLPLPNFFCLLGPYHFSPLLCPSMHEIFPWYLQVPWRDLCSLPFYCFP